MTTTPVISQAITTANDSANETGSQREPRITELSDGRILVSWHDTDNNYDNTVNGDFIGQMFEIDGTAIGNPFQLNTVWHAGTSPSSNEEQGHDIASMPDGGWMIVYEDVNSTTTHIRSERYDANGNLTQSISIASGSDSGDNHVSDPSIEIASNGDRVITFSREDGNGTDTRGVVFDNNTFLPEDDYGSRSEENWAPGATTNDTAILTNGNIVTVNEDEAVTSGNTRVNVRVCDEDGTNVRSFIVQSSANPWNWISPRVEALDNGGFVVTYVALNHSASDYGIRVAVYNNAGQTVTSPFYADFANNNGSSQLRYSFSDVAALEDGGFVVGWHTSGGIHVQRFDATGNTIGNELTLAGASPGFGGGSRFETFELTTTQDGRVMVVWSEHGVGQVSDNIQFLILDPRDDGLTITGTNGVDGLTATLGGSTINAGAGADNVLGRGGNDVFIDTDLTSGDRYNGRLGIDTIDYSGVTFGGTTAINLAAGTVINSQSGVWDYVENIENVIGSQGNDTITTVNATTNIQAEGGNDRVIVSQFVMNGDIYDGGSGSDWFDISDTPLFTSSDITINLNLDFWGIGVGSESVIDFENIDGANNILSSVETLIGNAQDNEIHGNGGIDHITGGGGLDRLYGGSNNDIFYMHRAEMVAGEIIDGGSGIDTMRLILSSSAAAPFDLGQFNTITSIEHIRGHSGANYDLFITMNANQFGFGGLTNTTFQGRGSSADSRLTITMGSDTNLSLSDITFTSNWQDIFINGDSSNETIEGSHANDVIDAAGGSDTISFANSANVITVDISNSNFQTTGEGVDRLLNFENIIGSAQADNLTGNSGDNFIQGGAGADIIIGGGGKDVLNGDSGNDTIHRNANGTEGSNVYNGGSNHDTLIGNGLGAGWVVDFQQEVITNNNTLWEAIISFENYTGFSSEGFIGNGDDNTVVFTGNFVNVINAAAGSDVVSAGDGNDHITGGKGNDYLKGQAGNDTFYMSLVEFHATETIDGGSDTDTLQLNDGGAFDLRQATIIDTEILRYGPGSYATEVVVNVNQLQGSQFSGLFGNAGGIDRFIIDMLSQASIDLSAISFQTWQNSDEIEIWGNGLDNTFVGSSQNDVLEGENGDDILEGGSGNDRLDGGADVDTASYASAGSGVTVSLLQQGFAQNTVSAGMDTLISIENLTGSNYNDTLTGDANVNVINGGAGNDNIYAQITDIIDGGADYDTLHVGNTAFRNYDMAAHGIEAMTATENGNNVNIAYLVDGSISENAFDTANTQTYDFYSNTYTSNWVLALQQFIDDNGNSRNIGYDLDNTEVFQYYQNTYNSSGQLVTQEILDDNGNQRVVGYDVDNVETFASYVNTYDTQNRLILQQIEDDNGNNRVIGYDVDDLEPWTYYQNTYNPAGDLIDSFVV